MAARLMLLITLTYMSGTGQGNENAKRLFDELLSNYNKLRRPVADPKDILTIRLKLRLSQIIDVHEKDQIMTTSVWLKQEWVDPKLIWNPMHYGNVTVLYVPASIIWTPDIVLYNNADSTYNITIATKATLHHTGLVRWEPPAVYKSMCQIEVEWFPFDEQTCHLKFGSWSYSEELLDLQHLDMNVSFSQDLDVKTGILTNIAIVERGVDLSEYYPSVEWDIIRTPARRHGKTYPSCCPDSAAYIDITYYIHIRRKPLFYTVNLIFPCVGISFLTIIVFYLPSDSGEKISLCISILVSLTVFFLLLTEIIPATSIVLPLIGKYLLFTMVMVTLSVLVTVVVLNVHFRRPTTHKMPPCKWVRKLFLHVLPRYLFMRRPLDPRIKRSFRRTPTDSMESIVKYPRVQSPSSFSTSTLLASTPLRTPTVFYNRNSQIRNANLDATMGTTTGLYDNVSIVGEIKCTCEKMKVFEQLYEHPRVLRAFGNLCFIANLLESRDRETKNEEDWKYVAMVLDRLFLLLFAAACFLGTVSILLQAPTLYDNAKPIDTRGAHQSELQKALYV